MNVAARFVFVANLLKQIDFNFISRYNETVYDGDMRLVT